MILQLSKHVICFFYNLLLDFVTYIIISVYVEMDAIGMMRIIAERTLEIDEELCVCFIDW